MKKRYKLISLIVFLLTNTLLLAQNPTDACGAGVQVLPVNTSCVTSNYTMAGSYADGGVVNATCATGGNDKDDGWYRFVATATTTTVDVSGDLARAVAVFTGSCGTGELGCDIQAAGTTASVSVTTTIGVTYYIQVHRRSGNNSATMTGTICVYSGAAAGSGADCANADPLTPGTQQCGTNSSAGDFPDGGGAPTNPCNGSYNDGEYWYSYVGTGQALQLDVSALSATYSGLYVIDACAGAGPNCVASYSSGSSTANFTVTTPALTLGTTYYIVIANWSAPYSTNFCLDATVVVPPAPAANDDCGTAIALTVNPDLLCGTTTAGTVLGATASTDANSCFGTDDDDVWFSFVATATTHYVSLLNVSGSVTDMYISIFTGTCGSLGTAVNCSDPNSTTLTGLTIGATYYVRVYTYTATGGQNTTFDVCVGTDPPPVTITGCSGNFYDSGGAGGVYGNNELTSTSYCSGIVGQCVTMTFTNFSTESCCDDLTIYDGPNTSSPLIGTYAGTTLNGQAIQASTGCLTFVFDSDGSVTGVGWAATVTCSACPTCSDGILNGQEVGIDCGGPTCPACPCASLPIYNDEACCATSLTVNPDQLCGTTTAGTVANATPSFNANTCFGSDDDDVWFSFVATSTSHVISLLNVAGSSTDMYFSVYGGTCNATGASLLCSDPNTNTVSSLTIGNTYFVRVYTYTSTGGQTSTFDICIGTPPPTGVCGNAMNNDFCSDPATLINDGGTWSSTTSGLYTGDTPGNINSVFCGSIENNSWYAFTATATTETFDFTSIFNCNNGWGIQAEVYDVTTDANGCCTSFTSVSNCWNPNNTTPATVTATGLTIGNTYYLMVDGQAGDDCDFTVNGWSGSGILPVTLITFEGYNYENGNKLIWVTESEINNDYYIIQKSTNAKNFIDAGIVDGNGNSSNINNYEFIDDTPYNGVTYYRLKQIDFDGKYEYSHIIAIESDNDLNITFYPNPSKGNLFFDISESTNVNYSIIYTNVLGAINKEDIIITEGTNTYQVKEFTNLISGVYFIQIMNEEGDIIKTQKIIKE